jgi:hypothetical protein
MNICVYTSRLFEHVLLFCFWSVRHGSDAFEIGSVWCLFMDGSFFVVKEEVKISK